MNIPQTHHRGNSPDNAPIYESYLTAQSPKLNNVEIPVALLEKYMREWATSLNRLDEYNQYTSHVSGPRSTGRQAHQGQSTDWFRDKRGPDRRDPNDPEGTIPGLPMQSGGKFSTGPDAGKKRGDFEQPDLPKGQSVSPWDNPTAEPRTTQGYGADTQQSMERPSGTAAGDFGSQHATQGVGEPMAAGQAKAQMGSVALPASGDELFQQLAAGNMTPETEHQVQRALMQAGVAGTIDDARAGAASLPNPSWDALYAADGMDPKQKEALVALSKWQREVVGKAGEETGYEGSKQPLKSKLGLGGPRNVAR
jgi:hypothetical protein